MVVKKVTRDPSHSPPAWSALRDRILFLAFFVLEMNTGALCRRRLSKMKSVLVLAVIVGFLSLPLATAQTKGGGSSPAASSAPACAKCSAKTSSTVETPSMQTIPGTGETMVVGRIENLIPIGVLTVLGCEKCSAEAVNWALQQGSSFEDIERTLRTVAAMQKLDCFKGQFGPDVVSKLEKPLAAAHAALDEARTRAANEPAKTR